MVEVFYYFNIVEAQVDCLRGSKALQALNLFDVLVVERKLINTDRVRDAKELLAKVGDVEVGQDRVAVSVDFDLDRLGLLRCNSTLVSGLVHR